LAKRSFFSNPHTTFQRQPPALENRSDFRYAAFFRSGISKKFRSPFTLVFQPRTPPSSASFPPLENRSDFRYAAFFRSGISKKFRWPSTLFVKVRFP
jgi:hypothetical protein